MATKVNLKKYLAIDGKWQFVPVLKVDGKPRPGTVVIAGKNRTGTEGTYYIEWREAGKRRQKPVGTSAREALDQWAGKVAELTGEAVAADPVALHEASVNKIPTSATKPTSPTVAEAMSLFLKEVKATKSAGTLDAYAADTRWVEQALQGKLGVERVDQVTRAHIIELLGEGRDQGLSQASINRRVMIGLRALRNSGAVIAMKKGDWPRVAKSEVEIYEPDEITTFLDACDARQRVLFQVFLCSGFRMREVSTLTWDDVNFSRRELSVRQRPEYKFTPKSYEKRTVPVPAALMAVLRERRKTVKGALVFPTAAHPKRPNYGGDAPDAHHLEECKAIAFAAGLNCGHCKVVHKRKVRRKGAVVEIERSLSCKTSPVCEQWYLHKWRHTFCTNMVQSGVDIKTLQVLAGHKDLATTEKYLQALRLSDMRSKIEDSSLAAYL